MKIDIKNINYYDLLKVLFLGILVIIGTFPNNDWSFSVGIDPPMSWAFNFIYSSGFDVGKHIIFPHGPLAFFMYPLQNNIIVFVIVSSLFKLLLVNNIYLMLNDRKGNIKWVGAFVIAYFISTIAGFNHILLANLILLYTNFYKTENVFYKYIAFLVTALAFYIKLDIALISGVFSASFLLYYFVKNRNIKTFLIDGFSIVAFILIFWLLMYGSLSGFLDYLIGVFHLIQDNSSAVSFYPENNWWVLSIFILIILVLPIFNKSKESYFYGILLLLSFYAVWKHGMSREDVYHVNSFLVFTIIALLIFNIFVRKHFFANIVLSVIAVYLLSFNMTNSVNYKPSQLNLYKASDFFQFISEFSELEKKANDTTVKNIKENKISKVICDKISNATVDVYPWDYSIIAANNFNWKPRVIIHSYASYTTWLDQKNAEHFSSQDAPEFLIWERNSIENSLGGSFNSIDKRYLLNDEPQALLQILKRYSYFASDGKFLILKKREQAIPIKTKELSNETLQWGEWIEVPKAPNSLLRAKLSFDKTFVQSLKNFVFKDEQFWIYLKLNNGLVIKYRIVPSNAKDGLWINPYLFDSEYSFKVSNISFRASNEEILTEDLSVEWEKITFDNSPRLIKNLFDIKVNSNKDIINSKNGFEEEAVVNWNNIKANLISKDSYKGDNAYVLNANSYSPTYEFSLDSLPLKELFISTACWLKSDDYNFDKSVSLVISISDGSGNILWQGKSIDDLFLANTWSTTTNYVKYINNKENCKLKVYLWNQGESTMVIDNFKVSIRY